jgi:hypothetical protein
MVYKCQVKFYKSFLNSNSNWATYKEFNSLGDQEPAIIVVFGGVFDPPYFGSC